VRLNSLRRIDGSTTNKPHSLTKREIQTQTAKLGQAVRQIADFFTGIVIHLLAAVFQFFARIILVPRSFKNFVPPFP
jgi:hypothetical protein